MNNRWLVESHTSEGHEAVLLLLCCQVRAHEATRDNNAAHSTMMAVRWVWLINQAANVDTLSVVTRPALLGWTTLWLYRLCLLVTRLLGLLLLEYWLLLLAPDGRELESWCLRRLRRPGQLAARYLVRRWPHVKFWSAGSRRI